MHTGYLIGGQSLSRKVLVIYGPDRKLVGTIGNGQTLEEAPVCTKTAGPNR